MQYLQDGWRGFWFLVTINTDRFLILAVLLAAMAAATWIAHPEASGALF